MANSAEAAPAFCTLCANNCSVNSLECGRGYKFFTEMANVSLADESKEAKMYRENRDFIDRKSVV